MHSDKVIRHVVLFTCSEIFLHHANANLNTEANRYKLATRGANVFHDVTFLN